MSTPKVKEASGEPMRYFVTSEEYPNFHHLVDLTENGGGGWCSCTDFSARCQTNYNENGGKWVEYGTPSKKNPARTQCKHIHAARQFFLNKILQDIAQELNPKNQ